MKPCASAAILSAAVVAIAAFASAQSPPGERMQRRAPPPGSARWAHGGQEELAEQFRKRRPKPEEVQAKLRELHATADARRDEHRAELRKEFGNALGRKDLDDELRKHARRNAFLSRAKLVATTELDEPKRSAALARIDKLSAQENTRHDRAVQKLKAAK